MKLNAISAAVIGLVMGVQGAAAATTTYGFSNIAGGDTVGDALASKFWLEVSDGGSGKVMVSVNSAANPGATYFIGGVFIDDDPAAVLGSETNAFDATDSSALVAFSYSGSGAAFPQGSLVSFGPTSRYFSNNGGGNIWAIQPGEHGSFLFDGTLSAVLAAFDAGTLRFGIHVQGLPRASCSLGSECSDSDSYINKKVRGSGGGPLPTVPLPASALLLLGGLGGLAGLKRRKR